VLADGPPEVVQLAIDAQNDLIEVPGVTRARSTPAELPGKVAPNICTQRRMLSCVTQIRRSARISSTSRRLRLKT
jgi:hypothetical protein